MFEVTTSEKKVLVSVIGFGIQVHQDAITHQSWCLGTHGFHWSFGVNFMLGKLLASSMNV